MAKNKITVVTITDLYSYDVWLKLSKEEQLIAQKKVKLLNALIKQSAKSEGILESDKEVLKALEEEYSIKVESGTIIKIYPPNENTEKYLK